MPVVGRGTTLPIMAYLSHLGSAVPFSAWDCFYGHGLIKLVSQS